MRDVGRKATNTITGIYGWKGGGKTLICTLFLYLESLKRHLKIFSNYQLGFDFEWLEGESLVELDEKLDNSIIGLDELHDYADCRNSGSLQNKRVAHFFLQSRHTNSDIFWTSQYKDQVDKRIRRITDVDVICENLMMDSDGDGDDDIFRITIKDRRILDRPVITRKIYAQPLFSMYDSTHRINPFEYKKKKKENYHKDV